MLRYYIECFSPVKALEKFNLERAVGIFSTGDHETNRINYAIHIFKQINQIKFKKQSISDGGN